MKLSERINKEISTAVENCIGEAESITREVLLDACFDSYEWAESGPFPTGSNYWMAMFVDKLQEKLKYTIE